MKFYLGMIDERNGEREYSSPVRLRAEDDDKADTMLDNIARTWYGEPDDDVDADHGDYWFCGEVIVSAGRMIEVTEATFNEVGGLVVELTGKAHGE